MRKTFDVWRNRYEELGEAGLKDRSRRPKTSPRVTHFDMVGKIVYLRRNYDFGPAKIALYLERYHDVGNAGTPCAFLEAKKIVAMHNKRSSTREVDKDGSVRTGSVRDMNPDVPVGAGVIWGPELRNTE